jgi:hypothetical protein
VKTPVILETINAVQEGAQHDTKTICVVAVMSRTFTTTTLKHITFNPSKHTIRAGCLYLKSEKMLGRINRVYSDTD